MMRSFIRFIDRNRPGISLILLMAITGTLAALYFYQPVSTLIFRIAVSAISISVVGFSLVIGTWIGSRPTEASRKMDELLQELDNYNQTLDRIINDKEQIKLCFLDLQKRVQNLEEYLRQNKSSVNRANQNSILSQDQTDDLPHPYRLFTKQLSPQQRDARAIRINEDVSTEIDLLLTSYPRLIEANKDDVLYRKTLNKELNEHHEKIIAIMYPFLHELGERVVSCEKSLLKKATSNAPTTNSPV